MATITLSEFNQNPSRVTRLAEEDDVVITRRGVPTFRVTKIPPAKDRIQEMIDAGLADPPRNPNPGPFPRIKVRPDLDIDELIDWVKGDY